MNEESTSLYRPGLSGGTKWWYRLIARIFKTENWPGYAGSQDDTVDITCACEERLWANGHSITWCPKCHRGYTTELRTYMVPAWLYRLKEPGRVGPSQKYIDYLQSQVEKNSLHKSVYGEQLKSMLADPKKRK